MHAIWNFNIIIEENKVENYMGYIFKELLCNDNVSTMNVYWVSKLLLTSFSLK